MIYKLHYWLYASGANVFSILIGVFIETYTDASPSELGTLLMVIPFLSLVFRPLIASLADRKQAHRKYLIICLIAVSVSYSPFVIIPLLGESIYRVYARACWYCFMLLKVVGDIAFGGASAICDSLAINYAKRIGTTFMIYRVWGTISWMFFGIVIGQVNEMESMPKYVPGFLVLTSATLLDAFLIWLWPKEYFEMLDPEVLDSSAKVDDALDKREKEENGKKRKKKESALTKSLMPKEVVWAQAKQKLLRLPIWCRRKSKVASSQTTGVVVKAEEGISVPDKIDGKAREKDSFEINKKTQLRILAVLFRRDARIILYLVYFLLGGASMAALAFFYISLSNICHTQGTCNFSQLAGFLQVSMSFLETFVFLYIARVMVICGRVNMAALSMLLTAIKFTFYGTVWTQINPYYALLVEGLHGLVYGIHLTLMVEMGHLFSSEVQYIIPELLERGIITANTDTSRLKYSLAATMQAIVSSAFDGFGRGFGALAYGFLLERISFETLWLVIGITAFVFFVIIVTINIIDVVFSLKLGLDAKVEDVTLKKVPAELDVTSQQSIDLKTLGATGSGLEDRMSISSIPAVLTSTRWIKSHSRGSSIV